MSRLLMLILMLAAMSGVASAAERADTTAVREGKRCPEFRFKDTEGRERTLGEFRGSYVYIDVWASWCYPCRREYPRLQELEKRLKGRNIVFVGISCDQTEFRWQGAVRMMEGEQWWTAGDAAFEKAFGVDRIPRFILIDRRGRVLRAEMSRPSDPATEEYLKGLPGIDKAVVKAKRKKKKK